MVALLERAEELDAVAAAVREAGRRRGSVVLVSGEAGIGKTSMVRAFTERVAGRARLLVGGCDDLVTARPLGPLRDAAAGSAGALEMALLGGGDVFSAIVEELSGPRVTVVVVEDLHWADDATLDVLGYLARRLADLPAVLVLTYRDDAAPAHPVHRLLGSLVGGPVVRLPLRALSSAAVVGLAAGSGWDPERLYTLTGGNPFYVTEALAAAGPGVPVSVSDAVLARVGRLDETARAAVEQLSVVPMTVGLDLANVLLGHRLDALADAERRGIVTSRPDGVTFRHELARRAVEQSLPPLRRRTLHRAVVGALQSQPLPDLARLVHHAVQADDGATVSRFAPPAGREAVAAGSHRQALAHFSAALRHGHRLAEDELARLVDEHAWELYNAGHFAEALRGGERAVRLRRRGTDRGALAEALVRLSRHRFMAGDPDGADAAAEEAVVLVGDGGSPDAMAFAATYLGAVRALTERAAEAPAILRRADELATSAGRTDLVALCRNYESGARADLDDEARLATLRESLGVALKHGFHEVAARGYTNLGELCFRFRRLDELERCVGEGLAFTRERGFSSHAHNLEVHQGLLALRRGDWAAAEALLREIALSAEPGMPNAAGPYGRLLARRGAAEAEELLEGAWAAALRQRSVTELALAGAALAEWAWLGGRPERLDAVVRAWRPHAARPTAARAWLRCCATRPEPDSRSSRPRGTAGPGRRGCAGSGARRPRGSPLSATLTKGRWSWPSRARWRRRSRRCTPSRTSEPRRRRASSAAGCGRWG